MVSKSKSKSKEKDPAKKKGSAQEDSQETSTPADAQEKDLGLESQQISSPQDQEKVPLKKKGPVKDSHQIATPQGQGQEKDPPKKKDSVKDSQQISTPQGPVKDTPKEKGPAKESQPISTPPPQSQAKDTPKKSSLPKEPEKAPPEKKDSSEDFSQSSPDPQPPPKDTGPGCMSRCCTFCKLHKTCILRICILFALIYYFALTIPSIYVMDKAGRLSALIFSIFILLAGFVGLAFTIVLIVGVVKKSAKLVKVAFIGGIINFIFIIIAQCLLWYAVKNMMALMVFGAPTVIIIGLVYVYGIMVICAYARKMPPPPKKPVTPAKPKPTKA